MQYLRRENPLPSARGVKVVILFSLKNPYYSSLTSAKTIRDEIMEQNSHKFKYNFQRTITNIHSNSYLGGEGGGGGRTGRISARGLEQASLIGDLLYDYLRKTIKVNLVGFKTPQFVLRKHAQFRCPLGTR